MDGISDILKARQFTKSTKRVEAWQDLASEIYTELKGVDTEKSSVFMYCRNNYSLAYQAYQATKKADAGILYWFSIVAPKKQ